MKTAIKMAMLASGLLLLANTARTQTLTPAELGRKAFLANNCYGCHGGRAGGSSFGAPQFRSERAELGDLTEAIREGGDHGMPAFPNLTSTDISNLYAYFQSLRTSTEPIFNQWWVAIPTASTRPRVPRINASVRAKRFAPAKLMK